MVHFTSSQPQTRKFFSTWTGSHSATEPPLWERFIEAMGLNTLEPNWSHLCKVLREQDFNRFNSHHRFYIQFNFSKVIKSALKSNSHPPTISEGGLLSSGVLHPTVTLVGPSTVLVSVPPPMLLPPLSSLALPSPAPSSCGWVPLLWAVHTLLMISAHQPFQAHILPTACHIMHLPFRTTGLFFKLVSSRTAWSVHLATDQNRTG